MAKRVLRNPISIIALLLAMSFLICGSTLRLEPVARSFPGDGPCIGTAVDTPAHMVAWHELPKLEIMAACDSQTETRPDFGVGHVRPAWGSIWAIVGVILCLWFVGPSLYLDQSSLS